MRAGWRTAAWITMTVGALTLHGLGCADILGIEDWSPLATGGSSQSSGHSSSSAGATCVHDGDPCDDGNDCTENDTCHQGECVGIALDGVALPKDLQTAGDCRHVVC